MSNIPEGLRYTSEHEWVLERGDGVVRVGITDHAQSQLGDLVFVELPEVGEPLEQGAECAVVESVKAASDVFSPLAGKVVAVNGALGESPELVNQDPYGEGWVLELRLEDPAQLGDLLDAAAYGAVVEAEAH
jgi:glycine cleavage system H protein